MVATYGMPHAWTWNIGVSGMYTSSRWKRAPAAAELSVPSVPRVCSTSCRWLKYTPLGMPVVPVE